MTTSASLACTLLQFGELAFADVGGGHRFSTPLGQTAHDDGAGGRRQAAQFFERIAADPGPLGQGHADQKRLFEANSEVAARSIKRHVDRGSLLSSSIVAYRGGRSQAPQRRQERGCRRCWRMTTRITRLNVGAVAMTIRIKRTLDSEILHLPELCPLLGKAVEITVQEQPAVLPGTGDWAALEEAARDLEGYDFDAWRRQRDYDLHSMV